MSKRCIICDEDAVYQVKGTNNYYCKDCAKEYFNDVKLLVKIEDEISAMKKFVEEKVE